MYNAMDVELVVPVSAQATPIILCLWHRGSCASAPSSSASSSFLFVCLLSLVVVGGCWLFWVSC